MANSGQRVRKHALSLLPDDLFGQVGEILQTVRVFFNRIGLDAVGLEEIFVIRNIMAGKLQRFSQAFSSEDFTTCKWGSVMTPQLRQL
jgi:hypothetical protein